nr:uncharacterized protein LOC126056281 [Helicoverpa armigera]
MGKRKHHDEEEYLARKIRKYEKKMSRVRRKQRSYRSASISSLERDRYSDNEYPGSPQETPQNGGAPYEVNFTLNQTSHSNVSATNSISVPAPTATFAPAPDPTSVVIPVATSTPNIPPPLENAPTEGIQELDLQPDILCLLGEEPVREEKFGVNVHKDIASRWSDILVNGIKDQTKNEILKAYNVPDNLRVAQAPTLNPEIRAAVNESALKRDDILIDKQKILSVVITSLANTITSVFDNYFHRRDVQVSDINSKGFKLEGPATAAVTASPRASETEPDGWWAQAAAINATCDGPSCSTSAEPALAPLAEVNGTNVQAVANTSFKRVLPWLPEYYQAGVPEAGFSFCCCRRHVSVISREYT